MAYENDLAPVDMYRIELEARRMRAEAFRNLVLGARARVTGLFSGRAASGARTA